LIETLRCHRASLQEGREVQREVSCSWWTTNFEQSPPDPVFEAVWEDPDHDRRDGIDTLLRILENEGIPSLLAPRR